jgi:protein-disulfide isomerase
MNITDFFSKKLLPGLLLAALCVLPAAAEISDADFAKAFDSFLSKDDNIEKIAKAFERFAVKKQKEEQKKQQEAAAKEMEEQFKNPVKVDQGKSPSKGNPSAKVTVFEFSDFQCPYCKRGSQTVKELLAAYPNDVKVVFKNLPLPFHPEARPAAKAAYAAQQQGKFWEMYDLLFNNQQELSSASYEKFATELKLDVAKFKSDMESEAAEKHVAADEAEAEKLGFNGTPAFVVGGVKVVGAQPLPRFKQVVDRLLKKQ